MSRVDQHKPKEGLWRMILTQAFKFIRGYSGSAGGKYLCPGCVKAF